MPICIGSIYCLDNQGITEDSPNFNQRHDYSQYGRFNPGGGDPFESIFDDFFGGGNRFRSAPCVTPKVIHLYVLCAPAPSSFPSRFNFGRESSQDQHRLYHKQSITSKAYWNNILPNSAKQPYLILFYSDWCFSCLRVEPIWARRGLYSTHCSRC